jgi:hypothetical protein
VSVDPLDALTARELLAAVDDELAKLSTAERSVLMLCGVENLSLEEAARRLGWGTGATKGRLQRARAKLRARLGARGLTLPAVGLGLLGANPPVRALQTALAVACGGALPPGVRSLVGEGTGMRWLIAKTVLALTLFGAVALAGGWGGRSGPTPQGSADPEPPRAGPPKQPPEKPVPDKKEPAWMAAFHSAYRLKDGEYVKRVAAPYIPERNEYMYRVWYRNKQAPDEAERARARLDRDKMTLALFLDFDGNALTTRTCMSASGLAFDPELRNSEKIMNVWDAVTLVTGRDAPEVVIDPDSKDDPLLDVRERQIRAALVRGQLTVGGDFVTRKGAPLDRLVPQLERILRDECGADVRLTVREEDQQVYVVGGRFTLAPRKWRNRDEIDLYADEAVLNKNFDKTRSSRPESDDVLSGWNTATPATLLRHLGAFTNARIVCDGELPTGPVFNVYRHTRRPDKATAEELAADRDPEKVLANVAAQTGLTFRKEMRKVPVVVLSVPKKK